MQAKDVHRREGAFISWNGMQRSKLLIASGPSGIIEIHLKTSKTNAVQFYSKTETTYTGLNKEEVKSIMVYP